jgi:hypothetical protein
VQMVDLGRQLIYQELLYVTIKTGDPQPGRDLRPQVGMGSMTEGMIDEATRRSPFDQAARMTVPMYGLSN